MQSWVELVNFTHPEYPLCLNEKEALKFLKLINNLKFRYLNCGCYDCLDYEKIIYIEKNFSQNEEIMKEINNLKDKISESYILRIKYLNRVLDKSLDLSEEFLLPNPDRDYDGVPRDESHTF